MSRQVKIIFLLCFSFNAVSNSRLKTSALRKQNAPLRKSETQTEKKERKEQERGESERFTDSKIVQ
jgi:hypothetical protein